jgi:phosphate transport system permease protein
LVAPKFYSGFFEMASNIAVHNRIDMFFKWTAAFFASIVLLLMVGIFVELVKDSHSSLQRFGVSFLISQSWNPVTEKFGAASSLFGTLLSTALALLMAIPLSLVIALFLVELAHPVLGRFVGGAIELLAAIPSIIYGMWGLFIFAPFMADYVQPFLSTYLGFLPFFQGTANGLGMLSAGIILALMILPFVCSVTRDVFQMVPSVVKESAYGMGATTWEVTRKVTLRYGMRGVIGAGFLGLGRALGETMAVTFVIGNTHRISMSLFDAGNTIASTLANEFAEASEPLYLSALINLGLVLFILTVVVQVLAQLWLWRIYKRTGTL